MSVTVTQTPKSASDTCKVAVVFIGKRGSRRSSTRFYREYDAADLIGKTH
jgi:hypothetical protein